MENINEAPVVAAGTKVVAGLAKAGAKAAAKGGKAASKSSKNISKAASKFKRPNIRSYKDPKTGKVDIDRYRSDQAKYKKIKQDQKNRPDMSDVKPDGPSDARTQRGERKLKAIDKITQRKKANLKKGMQDAGDIAKKTADKAGEYGKKSTSAVTKGFGTTSFTKEGITFKDYLNKL